jgi:predicted transcriptional regulator
MTSYFYTYNAIFEAQVSGSAKLVYAYLFKCANATGKCYPSHKTIGAAAGVCVSTVKKSLAELESAGLIVIQGQARPERGRLVNTYTIIKEAVKGFFVTYGNIIMERLTAKARLVYLYFCRLASGRDSAFPSHKTTAKACGLSVSGARLAIDELEAVGLIGREAQYRDNGGQRANLYTFITETTDGADNGGNTPSYEDGGAEMDGADSVEPQNLVRFDAERPCDSVDGDNRQSVDRSALQVADGGIAQIGFLGQFKLAQSAFLTQKLDFEPNVLQKLVFLIGICLTADRHSLPSLRRLLSMNILTERGLQTNEAKRYNIVVKLQSLTWSAFRARRHAPPQTDGVICCYYIAPGHAIW